MRAARLACILAFAFMILLSHPTDAAVGMGARSGISGKILWPTKDLEATHDTGYAFGFTAQGNSLIGALALRSDLYWGSFSGKELSVEGEGGPLSADELNFGTAGIGPFWRFTTLDVGVLAEYTWGDRYEWAAKSFANLNFRRFGLFAELRWAAETTWFGGGLTLYLFGF